MPQVRKHKFKRDWTHTLRNFAKCELCGLIREKVYIGGGKFICTYGNDNLREEPECK